MERKRGLDLDRSDPDNTLLGHGEAARQIMESWQAGRMHHAWLLTGMEGIGKATFALKMVAFVLSGGHGDPDHPLMSDRQVQHALAETHPDMLVVRRAIDEKTNAIRQNIVVEDALRVATFLHKTSSHGGWRVVVVDEAHTLNRNAQNAILKILEEPPSRAMIIMTATTVGAMLPTIRSRCRVLQFASLNDDIMRTLLKRHAAELGEDETSRLLQLAGGSIGKALRILKTEALAAYGELVGLFEGLPRLDAVRAHKLADKIASKAETDTYEVATDLFVDMMRSRVIEAAKSGTPAAEVLSRLRHWDNLRETLKSAEHAHLDRKLALITSFNAMRR